MGFNSLLYHCSSFSPKVHLLKQLSAHYIFKISENSTLITESSTYAECTPHGENRQKPSRSITIINTAAFQWSRSPPSTVTLEGEKPHKLTNTLWFIIRS